MASYQERHTIPVVVENDSGLLIANFNWGEQPPYDTYTIDVASAISVRLDKHLPVRPAQVTWDREAGVGSETVVDELFGRGMSDAMLTAATAGFCAIDLSLSPDNRQAIARLQIDSPSSPRSIKEACRGMLTKSRSVA